MKRLAFIICFLFLPFGGLTAAAVRVDRHVDTEQTIYIGSQFSYKVVIQGTNQVEDVDVSSLSAYYPVYTGQQSAMGTGGSYIIVSYKLFAVKSGMIKLPGVKVKVGGKKYTTKPININVVEPPVSDEFELELIVPKRKCYVGEPVAFSLKWSVTERAYKARLGIAFIAPILMNDAFDFKPIINEPQYRRKPNDFKGFPILGKNYPFAWQLVNRKGQQWRELTYSAVFIPRRSGNIVIEPSTVVALLGVAGSEDYYSGRYKKAEPFMARSKGVELEVAALPDTGRPKEAYGLVGNYTISADAAPDKVDVGEPITLSVKVGGNWMLAPVLRPEIEKIDGFADNFKISTQREEPVIKGGEKIFTTTIRATNDLVSEIPSIPLVFFDTEKGKYVTAKSKPVPLKVNPSDVVTIDKAVFSGKGGINSHVEAVKKGMAANVIDIDLVSQDFSPVASIVSPGYLSLWGIPFAAFIVSAVVRLMTNTSDAKVAASRRRRARRNAESMLKAAKSKQDVATAMQEFVGWRFGKSSGGLTGMDCERIISEATSDADIAKEYRGVFEKCEAAQYTGGGGACDRDEIENVINVISRIDKKS